MKFIEYIPTTTESREGPRVVEIKVATDLITALSYLNDKGDNLGFIARDCGVPGFDVYCIKYQDDSWYRIGSIVGTIRELDKLKLYEFKWPVYQRPRIGVFI